MRRIVSRFLTAGLIVFAFTATSSFANAADTASNARPLITHSINENQLAELAYGQPAGMKTATDEGRVASGMQLPKMQLLLKRTPEQQLALENVLKQMHTPGTTMYHQALTPEEYADTFGLAASDLTKLQQWLESHGFHVVSVDNGKLAITFSGTAGQAEEAFHVEIHNYKSEDLRTHFANTAAVRVPVALADSIAGVSGLDNFSVMHEANYDGPVVIPQTGESTKSVHTPETPAIVGRVQSVDPGTGGEGTFPSSGSVVTFVGDGDHSNAGVATTTTVSLTPNTVTYASPATTVVTATVTWTGGGTPTGNLTFYDMENYLYQQVLLSSCTLTTNTYTCTYNWQSAGAVTSSPDTITAAYSGDSTYAASSGSNLLTVVYPHPNGGSGFFSAFTDTPGDQPYGTSVRQTVQVQSLGLFIAPTGNILITGNGGINQIANFTPLDSICFILCYTSNSATWNPYAYLQPGVYTLTATYSGDGNFTDSSTTTTFTVTGTGTTADSTTVTASPNAVSTTAPGTTFTTVTTWTGGGAVPTGQVSMSGPAGTPNGGGLGIAIFPITGATTSTGGGTYNGGAGTFTFNCVTNTSAKTITCTIVDSDVYDPLPVAGPTGNIVTATYGGNNIYEASSGTTIVYKDAASTTSVVTSGAAIYGEGTSVTYTASVVGVAGGGAPTGSVTFSGTTITGSPLTGTLGGCTVTRNVYTCTASVTAIVPYATAAGGYTVTAVYSGNLGYATSTGTVTETVNKQTPTLSAPTVTPNSEQQGSTGPVTLSTSLSWLGSGSAPTGAVTFLVAGTTVGTGTCVVSANSEVCTFSYNPSALGIGTYSVTAHYAGDGNYNPVTSTGTNLSITAASQTPTLTLTSSAYGSTTTGIAANTRVTLTATLTVPTYTGAWSGTVTFIDATTGYTVGTGTATGTGHNSTTATATVTFTTPNGSSANYPAGLNQFTASYAGNSYYGAAGPVDASPVYLAGILYSLTLNHNFSVNPGTYDGSPVGGCTNGVTTTTCTEPYLVEVYNFTSASQAISLTLTNAASGAFGSTTTCPASLAAGKTCYYSFFYEPPQGDGCVLNATTCTQGTYESGTWKVNIPATTNSGIGQPAFPSPVRSGAPTFPATLSGKALLPAGSLMVSPLSYTFPTIAAGATSNTLTIIVNNPNTSPVPFTYTAPTAPFSAKNTCNSPLQGGASCNIYITLGSTTPSTYSSSVVLTPANAPAITSSFSGTVQANNGLTMNTNYHNFGNVTLNTSSTFGLSITNNSGATQTLGVNYSTGQGYTISNGCGTTLAAAKSCTVTVTFNPSTTGTLTDSVTITSAVPIIPGGTGSSGSYSAVVNFTGNGVSGGQFTATSVGHNWGDIDVGTSGGNYGVELSNNTSAAITLSTGPLASTSKGFSLVASTCGTSLAINANCELIFTFTPNAVGFVSTTYPITSSSPLYSGGTLVSPSQITLSGTGQ